MKNMTLSKIGKKAQPLVRVYALVNLLCECARTFLHLTLCVIGMIMNLLFVCTKNKFRGPTCEEVFSAYEGINAISAGTNNDAGSTVSGDLIEWADIIFVMEKSHRNKISEKFKDLIKKKKLVCLDIPAFYDRMDSILVRVLKNKVSRYVRL